VLFPAIYFLLLVILFIFPLSFPKILYNDKHHEGRGGEYMAINSYSQDLPITVNIKDIGDYLVKPGITAADLVKDIASAGPYPVMAIIKGNTLYDLHHVLNQNCELELVYPSSEAGMRIYRRTAAFLLIKACRELYPDKTLAIKHSLSNGLYCEFIGYQPSRQDIITLEKRMQGIITDDLPINKLTVSKEEACNIFARQGQMDKVKLLEFRDKGHVHIYELDGFYEYFYGYMLPSTGMLSQFRLLNYPPGLILQTPEKDEPGKVVKYLPQPKLSQVFYEAKKWAEMLDTPHVAALNDIITSGRAGDLIRVNEALHEKKIAYIADRICADPNIRLVLISGPSSSGKTTFAQRLLIQLRVNGRRPVSVSLDDYFIDRDSTPRDENGDFDFEALEALKLDLFNDHLLRLIQGEEVETPSYNFKAGCCEVMGKKTRVPAGEPIIIEGIHGLNEHLTWSIPREQKFKIYISALTQLNVDYSNRIPTTDSRLLRRIVRDSRTRGYNARATLNRWSSVRRGEEKNIFPFQENADVMFNSSLVYELSVLRPYAEPLLREIGPNYSEHVEAKRLLKFLSYFQPLDSKDIPPNSIIREFVGGSCFDV
jgi:uridine kinase